MANKAFHKRKPSSDAAASTTASKRVKPGNSGHVPKEQPSRPPSHQGNVIKQNHLTLYYPHVETLRSYLISKLPASSRIRRKRLASVGKNAKARAPDSDSTHPQSDLEELLTRTLDTTLVAYNDTPATADAVDARRGRGLQQLRQTFSQSARADESHVSISNAPSSLQAETVDFAVWLMFTRDAQLGAMRKTIPDNVLCFGFQRTMPHDRITNGAAPPCTIPGLYMSRQPQNAQCLKEPPWPQLLALLGASGVEIMTDLLMHCSLYITVDAGRGNYIQVTGKPLFALWYPDPGETPKNTSDNGAKPPVKLPSNITLVRNRIFYAKPSLMSNGTVEFGLRHIYALNRFLYYKTLPESSNGKSLEHLNRQHNLHLAMYIFPRQFGLHNVFTSSVDRSKTSHKFMDYTLREQEISAKFGSPDTDTKIPIPKRLRGKPIALVERLRIRHSKCAYSALLQLYCPDNAENKDVAQDNKNPAHESKDPAQKKLVPAQKNEDPAQENKDGANEDPPLVNLAVPLSQVSAFCQAVIQKVFPGELWGTSDVRAHNKAAILQRVDTFIRLLRYESQSLHSLLDGLKISEIEWLAPPGLQGNKMSKTDLDKRQEIFAELIYYLFDSFLIPLIRSNFYVTESNAHRNRLFYFRHDVWRRLTEPALASIKTSRLEEVTGKDALETIESHRLGCAQIRLLPKNTDVRAITNLSRRVMDKDGTRLMPSTNTVLEPVAAMFSYEMKQHPQRFGSSMLSMQNIYARLVKFRAQFFPKQPSQRRPVFYFAKVDVKSAFDTIPQDAMADLISKLPSHDDYTIGKHSEVTAPASSRTSHKTGVPERKWRAVAKATTDSSTFHDAVDTTHAQTKKNTVFVDTAYRQQRAAEELVDLAALHVQQNIVKIGKKYYRQKQGIPQGSVLSSMLCSYFYADLEHTELSFLSPADATSEGQNNASDCLLLRLIDDFLLITTDQTKAARFVEVMHRGQPKYGVQVNPRKSLVNFDLTVHGQEVPRHPAGAPFPYCGVYINVFNLNLSKDRETKKHVVFDSLTVERNKTPGAKFKQKTLSSTMFFDMSFNSRRTTLHNLHSALTETARRMWAYARCMPRTQRPSPQLTISTIDDLAGLAFAVLSGHDEPSRGPDYKFTVSQVHIKLILLHSFHKVLSRKQTAYKEVLAWIDRETLTLKKEHRPRLPKEFA